MQLSAVANKCISKNMYMFKNDSKVLFYLILIQNNHLCFMLERKHFCKPFANTTGASSNHYDLKFK